MMKRNLLFLLLFVASATQLAAQATLSIQGTVQNYDGSAVDDGEYDIIFKLYTVDNGGTPVWSETQTVDVTGGVYSALLGTVNPMNASFSEVYYLGITLPGGPELVPRSRLTSAPYALSLIGQSNTFPSSGAIGAGTATPDAGVELHVKDTEAEVKLLVESTAEAAKLEVKASAGSPSVLINSTNAANTPRLTLKRTADSLGVDLGNDLTNFYSSKPFRFWHEGTNALHFNKNGMDLVSGILNTSASSLQFRLNSDTRMTLNSSGVTISDGYLYVNTNSTVSYTGFSFYYGGSSEYQMGNPTSVYTSIRASNAIVGGAFVVNSDRRIKKDISTSNSSNDLANLLKLRVADYRMKDEIGHGNRMNKGFIAQEVAQVLPEAVSKRKEIVPDIYALAERATLQGEELTITIKDEHQLKIGEKVKLMTEKDNSGNLFEISRIDEKNSFTISGWTAGPVDKVFVYGREVADYHAVEYDYLHTLNLSATQELARRLFDLEKENEGLRSEVQGMNERLLKLETLVTGSAQR
jgi:hypothetical protein